MTFDIKGNFQQQMYYQNRNTEYNFFTVMESSTADFCSVNPAGQGREACETTCSPCANCLA